MNRVGAVVVGGGGLFGLFDSMGQHCRYFRCDLCRCVPDDRRRRSELSAQPLRRIRLPSRPTSTLRPENLTSAQSSKLRHLDSPLFQINLCCAVDNSKVLIAGPATHYQMDNRDSIERSSSELGTNTVINGAPTIGVSPGDGGDGYTGPPTGGSPNETRQVMDNVLQSDVRRKLRVLW